MHCNESWIWPGSHRSVVHQFPKRFAGSGCLHIHRRLGTSLSWLWLLGIVLCFYHSLQKDVLKTYMPQSYANTVYGTGDVDQYKWYQEYSRMIEWVLFIPVCFMSFQSLYLLEPAPRYGHMAAKSFGCKPCELCSTLRTQNGSIWRYFDFDKIDMPTGAETSIVVCSTLDRSCLDILLAIFDYKARAYVARFAFSEQGIRGQFDTIWYNMHCMMI